jgi:hypothetical protein
MPLPDDAAFLGKTLRGIRFKDGATGTISRGWPARSATTADVSKGRDRQGDERHPRRGALTLRMVERGPPSSNRLSSAPHGPRVAHRSTILDTVRG